jgi:hypothetical protein
MTDDAIAVKLRRQPGGIYVTKGMAIGVPKLSIAVDDGGQFKADIDLHVVLDTTNHWFSIAIDHVIACESASKALGPVWEEGDDGAALPLLEDEFSSGMQAAVATAVGLDAFYASLKEAVSIPPDLTAAWRRNRTSRVAQISEVFRRSFKMDSATYKQVVSILEQTFRLRDLAVHPPARMQKPEWHPRLQVGVEWRFNAFRIENVLVVARVAFSLVDQVLQNPRTEIERVCKFAEGSRLRLEPVFNRWKSHFGEL